MRGRYITARTRYRCWWKCTACGRMNRERGSIAAADRVRVNQFTDNLYDETQLSGELAQEKARRRFFRFQRQVNEGGWLQGLRVSGVCRKCGARQYWAPAVRHTWALVMAAACLALLLTVLGLPADGRLCLVYLASAAVAALLTEGASLLLASWRLGRRTDAECAPWLEEIPAEA